MTLYKFKIMIRLPQYFIAIFCFLLIAACDDTDKVSPALDRAQALQDDHADSALAILDSLRIEDMEDDAIRARYALLKTYVKANLRQLTAGDSSLIDIAVDYYDKEGMADEATRANYYKADIIYYAGDYAGAMSNALKSLEWNEKANNQRFKAKTYDLISDIYTGVFNYPQGIAYGRKAASLFSAQGLRKNQLYSLMKVAYAYAHDDFMEEKALELLDSLCGNFNDADSTALGMLHYRYRYPLSLLERHREAYQHYTKALSYWNGVDLFDNKPLVAKMFTNIGMYDSASYYLEQERMINPDYDNDLNYHSALCALADSLGDITLYNKELRRVSELERENVRFAMRDEVSLIERDFEHDRAEREHLRNERIRLGIIFTSVILVIVGVFIVLFVRQRHRLKVLELQQKEAETRQRNEELQQKEAETRQRNEELRQKEAETRQRNEELRQKEAETRQRNEELQQKEAETRQRNEELRQKEAETRQRNKELRQMEAETRQRNKELQAMEARTREELEALRNELQSVRKESAQLEKTLAEMGDTDIRTTLQSLDNLYKEFIYVTGLGGNVSDSKFNRIVESFNREIEKMRKPEYVARIQSWLDPRNRHIFSSLRRLSKPPKEPVLKMLTYILLGFSPRIVSLFCNIKVDNYYNKLSRLRKDVREADSGLYDILDTLIKANPFHTP